MLLRGQRYWTLVHAAPTAELDGFAVKYRWLATELRHGAWYIQKKKAEGENPSGLCLTILLSAA